MDRGRRILRRRRLTAVAGAAAACLVVVLPWAIISGRSADAPPVPPVQQRPPVATPTSTVGGQAITELPGGWVVTGAGSSTGQSAGRYVDTEARARSRPRRSATVSWS